VSEAGNTATTGADSTQNGDGQQQDGQHLEALNARMEQMSQDFTGGIDQLRQMFEQQNQAPQDGQQDDGLGLFDEFGDQLGQDAFGEEIDPDAARQAQQRLQSMIRQEAEGMVEPIKAQLDEMRMRGEANDIAREFPDLNNPEVVKPVLDAAHRHAQRLGNEDLAGEPWFIRMTYLAGRAEEMAGQETPAGGQDGIRLEGAGAGAPSQSLQEAEEAFRNRILNAGPRNPFGG
jgi:hypothetical protein